MNTFKEVKKEFNKVIQNALINNNVKIIDSLNFIGYDGEDMARFETNEEIQVYAESFTVIMGYLYCVDFEDVVYAIKTRK